MSTIADMWNGYVVGVVLIIVGIVIGFGLGLTNDVVLDAFEEAGVYADTPERWQGTYDVTTAPAIDLLYLVPYICSLAGVLILGLSAFRGRWNRRF